MSTNHKPPSIFFLISECCLVLEFMASLSDSYRLSTRVANSLHMQCLNTLRVLCRVFFLVSRLSTSEQRASHQASFVTLLTATEGIHTMTALWVSLRVQQIRQGEKMVVFCAISEFDTCVVTHTNLHLCECICCYYGTRYCRYPF